MGKHKEVPLLTRCFVCRSNSARSRNQTQKLFFIHSLVRVLPAIPKIRFFFSGQTSFLCQISKTSANSSTPSHSVRPFKALWLASDYFSVTPCICCSCHELIIDLISGFTRGISHLHWCGGIRLRQCKSCSNPVLSSLDIFAQTHTTWPDFNISSFKFTKICCKCIG